MKIFKVLSLMMIVALSAGFASCSNDDNNDDSIVGAWKLVKEQVTQTRPDGSIDELPEKAPAESTVIVFNDDQTGTITFGSGADEDVFATIWNLDGTKLTIVDEDADVWEYEILSNDGNQAVLRDVFHDGNWVITTVSTFTRVK